MPTLRIDYTNHSAQIVNDDGRCVEIYSHVRGRDHALALIAFAGWHPRPTPASRPDRSWSYTYPPDGRQHPLMRLPRPRVRTSMTTNTDTTSTDHNTDSGRSECSTTPMAEHLAEIDTDLMAAALPRVRAALQALGVDPDGKAADPPYDWTHAEAVAYAALRDVQPRIERHRSDANELRDRIIRALEYTSCLPDYQELVEAENILRGENSDAAPLVAEDSTPPTAHC